MNDFVVKPVIFYKEPALNIRVESVLIILGDINSF